MRIVQLDLRAFGPFTDHPLTFSESDGLVVLFGPNEAGKSSMLRALRAWLYGIPAQSTDNFIHEHQKMRVGGRLRLSSGNELAFVRRKGNKNTVLDSDGNPLDEGVLERFLSNVGEDVFSRMFGIDNDALVRGGRELLEEKGDVGQALFAAGMSGLKLRRTLQNIEKRAGELYKSGGSRQEIAETLKGLAEARKKTKEEAISGKELNDLEDRLRDAQMSVADIDAMLARSITESTRLRRISAALPKLGTRTELLSRLAVMQDVPLLPKGFAEQRREAQRDKKRAEEELAVSAPELERLARHLEELSEAGTFTPYADKIELLLKRLGAHLKGQRDLVGLEAKQDARLQEARRLMAGIRPGLPLEDQGLLHVADARKKRIKELALRRESILCAEAGCIDALDLVTVRLEDARQALASMEPGQDESELEQSIDARLRQGDLEKVVRTARQQQEVLQDEAQHALARLGLWSGTVQELERLPVPAAETLARFQADYEDLAAERKAVEKRLHDLGAEREEIEGDIEGMLRKGTALTELELFERRQERDDTWRRIRNAWLDQAQLDTPPSLLARGYEDKVRTADDAADSLRDNADQVAKYDERRRHLERVRTRMEKDFTERQRISDCQERMETEWKAAWSPTGIEPLPPKEMQAWLGRHGQLLELAKQIRSAYADERAAEQEMAAGTHALNACLRRLGKPACGTDEPYGKLIEGCKTLVARLRDTNNARATWEQRILNHKEDRRQAEKKLEQAQKERAQWQKGWTECMGWLQLPPDTSIAEADSYLEKLDGIFKHTRDAAELGERIAGIKEEADSLDAEVRALVGSIAPDLKDRGLSVTIEELQRRSGRDKEAIAQRLEYRKQQAETQKRLDHARATLAQADRTLMHLCAEAGCANPDDLEPIERKSEERQRLTRELEGVEESLREIAKGMPLERLAEEASAVDGDTLPALINAANEEIGILQNKKDRENQNMGQITERIAALQQRSGAAEAAGTAQEHLALIGEQSRQYAMLKLASIVLRAEIKKYQALNQGPLVARAGKLFTRLTVGSFAGLSVGYSEKDEPCLLGLRQEGASVPVEGMSDGTRDQLYLSLRLATLEKFLENSEPMPFVVDDILIRFDDERAKATLEVLADLAGKTQVLFFTHHARLFDFAQSPEMAGRVRALRMRCQS